nr:hypothetical protein [Bacteroides acidifaciens]
MRFVLTPWVSANLRTWVLPRPKRRMMSKQEYQCSDRLLPSRSASCAIALSTSAFGKHLVALALIQGI